MKLGDRSNDIRWALLWLASIIAMAPALLVELLGPPLHLGTGGTGYVAARPAHDRVVLRGRRGRHGLLTRRL